MIQINNPLVDPQTASPELAATIFDCGILLVSDPEHATALRILQIVDPNYGFIDRNVIRIRIIFGL